MYCEAIRKIFTSKSAIDINESVKQARDCGYKLLNFNGEIYVIIGEVISPTKLHINDFKVNP